MTSGALTTDELSVNGDIQSTKHSTVTVDDIQTTIAHEEAKQNDIKSDIKKKKKKQKKKKKNSGDGAGDGDEEDEQDEGPEPVPFLQVFRYATSYEKMLMVVGLVAAFIAGLSIPAMIILFGTLTDAFIYQDLNLTQMVQDDPELANNSLIANMTEEELEDYLGIDTDFHHDLRVFGFGVTVIGVIELITGYIFVAAMNNAAEAQIFRIRGLFLRSILRQEIGWFDTHQTNDFASRVTEDINKMQEGMGEKIGMFVFFMTNFVGSLINAFVHGWQLTLVILTVVPLLGITTGVMAKVQTSLTSLELKEYARAGSIAEEVLSSIRTVVSYGGESKEVERYEKNLVHAKAAGVKRGMISGAGMGLMWFFIYASYALAFWYGTKLILDSRPPDGTGQYEPSDLIIVFFSILMGAMNIGQSSPYIEAFNVARGAAGTLYGIIERTSEIDPMDDRGARLKQLSGTIEFTNVKFNYPSRSSVKILEGINLQVKPGQTVALVGPSGCGKSTCIQLIQRFYDPMDGSVCLDGTDIRELNIGWLRDQIGIVGQEPVLFGTTIEENIRYGKDDVTFDEIEAAAKEANAHDFIMKLPKKYQTQVGERGTQISGGQKQRIAIARALIKKPKILLLDEATSALDNQSEAIVQRALDKVRKGRTTVIVAHRLSTIRSADMIVAMQDGKVVETGTHKELMKKDGLYRLLVNAQLSPQEVEKAATLSESESEDENEDEGLADAVDDILDELILNGPSVSRTASIRQSNKKQRRKSSTQKRKSLTGKKSKEEEEEDEDLDDVSTLEIVKLNSPEWYLIVGGVIGAGFQGCLLPAFAIIFGNVLGTLAVADPEDARAEANKYALFFLVLGIIAAVAIFFQDQEEDSHAVFFLVLLRKTYMFAISGEALTMRLRRLTFETMLRQEMGWFDEEKNSVGALCSRLSGDASAVQGATGSRIGTVVQAVTTLACGIVIALYYNMKLGAVALPFVPFVILSIYIQSKMLMGQSLTESLVLEEAGKLAIEAIGNIRTVAGLHKEQLFVDSYTSALREPHLEALKNSHLRGLAFGFAQSVMFFAYAAVMFYGGHLVEINEMEFEDVFKVAEGLILGTAMVGQAVAFAPNYGKAKVAAARLATLFNRRPAIDASAGVGLRMTGPVDELGLKDVHFAYPTRASIPILRGMTVIFAKGETVALVGSSGCGKSTIISLLERFYDAKSGVVSINEKDIQALNVGYVRSLFGLVSQEPVLFDRTIAENIAYGDNTRTFSQEDIELVAKQANIHDFVNQLPDRYNTRVGTKGTQLSGGQKQRIAIARALIRNPQVLLLDEATSALDTESEKIVQETLEEVQQGRTSIIIAHRLSTIRGADKIAVVHEGQIVESGTHEELMESGGHYCNLYRTNA